MITAAAVIFSQFAANWKTYVCSPTGSVYDLSETRRMFAKATSFHAVMNE